MSLEQRANEHLRFWRAIANDKFVDPTMSKGEIKEMSRIRRDAEMYVAGAEAILGMVGAKVSA